jgi:hypothetical protein
VELKREIRHTYLFKANHKRATARTKFGFVKTEGEELKIKPINAKAASGNNSQTMD